MDSLSVPITSGSLNIEKESEISTSSSEIDRLMIHQREFFNTGHTKSLKFRKSQLKRLKTILEANEEQIITALQADLHRHPLETKVAEIGIIISEINFALKNLRKWMKPKKEKTPLFLFKASTFIHSLPKGLVLIIGPWNYPLQLIIAPAVAAIAAGNCVVIKPSEVAPNTSQLIAELINNNFDPAFMHVEQGGISTAQMLLKKKWDHILFTGGTRIGRIVMQAAAEKLTPVTLELGGKSPCVVDKDINLQTTARRIIQGKFFNAGQTCIAPDYILVHSEIKEVLIEELKSQLEKFYGTDPKVSKDYPRIINNFHFNRLASLILPHEKIITGGETDQEQLYIAPTIIDDVTRNSKMMKDEIFGPLLPIITFSDIQEPIDFINSFPKALTIYIFSKNKNFQEFILENTSSGGAMINDTLLHWSSPHFPVGGIGNSGMGNYHGKYGFDTFSQKRGVVKKSILIDSFFRYPPYTKLKSKLVSLFQ